MITCLFSFYRGARHGLHLSGKLQRIEEQESLHGREKKLTKQSDSALECKNTGDEEVGKKRKKKKNKRKLVEIVADDEEPQELLDVDEEERTGEESKTKIERKKKKKRTKDRGDILECESAEDVELGSTENALTSLLTGDGDDSVDCENKRKRTKRSNASNGGIGYVMNGDSSRINGLDMVDEEGEETHKKKREKQKSKKKSGLDVDGSVNKELQDCVTDKAGLETDGDGTKLMGNRKKSSKKKKKSKFEGQCE